MQIIIVKQALRRIKRKKKSSSIRLLASGKVPNEVVRAVIRCYVQRMSPADAAQAARLSHVTIYRLYGHIRRRLIAIGIYKTFERHRDEINFSDDDELARFRHFFLARFGHKRGVRKKDWAEHVAEETYWYYPTYTPIQLYKIILKSARLDGPLNRKPDHKAEFYR